MEKGGDSLPQAEEEVIARKGGSDAGTGVAEVMKEFRAHLAESKTMLGQARAVTAVIARLAPMTISGKQLFKAFSLDFVGTRS